MKDIAERLLYVLMTDKNAAAVGDMPDYWKASVINPSVLALGGREKKTQGSGNL
jgi:hypothetical protein